VTGRLVKLRHETVFRDSNRYVAALLYDRWVTMSSVSVDRVVLAPAVALFGSLADPTRLAIVRELVRRHDGTVRLLDAGADPDLPNNKGWTALHQAAYADPAGDPAEALSLLELLTPSRLMLFVNLGNMWMRSFRFLRRPSHSLF